MFAKFKSFTNQHPVVKGMLSYAAIWPLGSCIQQKLAGQDQIDYARALRYSLYGSCFVAPTLFPMGKKHRVGLFPDASFKTAVKKSKHLKFSSRL